MPHNVSLMRTEQAACHVLDGLMGRGCVFIASFWARFAVVIGPKCCVLEVTLVTCCPGRPGGGWMEDESLIMGGPRGH